MSRYLERAEHAARLIDVNLVLMLDQDPALASERWERLFRSLDAAPPDGTLNARSITAALGFDHSTRQSIMGALEAARFNARQVREQLSSEMWEQLNLLYLQVSGTNIDDIWDVQPHAFFRSTKEGVQLFHGIAEATIRQGEGWHWMQLGRFIDRAAATARLLDVHFSEWNDATTGQNGMATYLDWVGLLKSRTAFEAYCQVYTADLRPRSIAEFLLLDPEFPHTLRFSVNMIHAALHAIARAANNRRDAQAERLAGRLRAMLEYTSIDEIMADGIHEYLSEVQELCSQIHSRVHHTYLAPPLEAVLES
jgi:uncharacterized alpha-E superfamily protein